MSDDKDVPRSRGPRLSRRTMLRLGLLAVPATQVSLGGVRAVAAQETKLGAQLIGKLEGAEVVTDPALIPKSFKEAPQLAELVKAGKLPPVQERIGQDPLVVKPLREIGKYGGTWRRASPGPSTPPTATGSPRTTSCSTTTTPAPSSFRISREHGRSVATGRPRPFFCAAG